MKKVLLILCCVIVLLSGCKTKESLINEGNWTEAYNIYKDENDDTPNELKTFEIGQEITFGSYEQDNNLQNGKEPIEWQVLDVEDGKALLISKYILDCKCYNEKFEDVTWETCTLRDWLNDEFYNTAFDTNEKNKIIKSKVTADNNPEYGTDQGNDTMDNVFLLSIKETVKYFHDNKEKRATSGTKYAKEIDNQGFNLWVNDATGNSSFWLRSPGCHESYASQVNIDGSLDWRGIGVSLQFFGVRPALWISYNFVSIENIEIKEDFKIDDTSNELKSFEIGQEITFGSYEQDNNLQNGKEPIEWKVIDVQDGKALLISKYILDCKCYNEKYEYVTWETCTLRDWLNDEFYNTAFDTNEKNKIIKSKVTADNNPEYDIDQGNDTMDKVFLLNINEAKKYFSSNEERATRGKKYAKKVDNQGSNLYVDVHTGNSYFWLRSLNRNRDFPDFPSPASAVNNVGFLIERGVSECNIGVRPAFWVSCR